MTNNDSNGTPIPVDKAEEISRQIEKIANEAQNSELSKAAEVLRAMAQLIRGWGTSPDCAATFAANSSSSQMVMH